MVLQDMAHWAKACFELTDFNMQAVVSVVTNGQSDDANGCNIEENLFGFSYVVWDNHSHFIIQ